MMNKVLAATALFLVAAGSPGFAQTHCETPPPGLSCPGNALVWVNTPSHIYHYQGQRYFGCTKTGKFMCEPDAKAEGDRAARNGQ